MRLARPFAIGVKRGGRCDDGTALIGSRQRGGMHRE
jgi:hypothetical protein